MGCRGGAKSSIVVNNIVEDTINPTFSVDFTGTPWTGASAVYVSQPGTITVQAQDNVGGSGLAQITITIVNSGGTTVNSQNCATAPHSPCQLNWDPVDGGNYRVTAHVEDVSGNAATDLVQTVNVDRTPPQVTWLAPADGTSVATPATLTLQAQGTDPQVNGYASGVAGIAYLDNGGAYFRSVLTENPAGSGIYPSILSAIGSYEIYARVVDRAGNFIDSAPFNLTITDVADITPPTVAITIPSVNNYFFSGTTTIMATATDNAGGRGVRDVEFFLDGVSMGAVDASAPYTMSWNTTVGTTNGSTYSITARACDLATPANCATSAPRLMRVWNQVGFTTCGTNVCSGGTPNCCTGNICQATACVGPAGR
jgi:hypothetical protein